MRAALRSINRRPVPQAETGRMRTRRWLLIGACAMLAGCSGLLPRARTEEVSSFAGFEAAREAFDRVVPYRTTLDELKALGFDARASGNNVRQIPYPQWVGRLVPNPTLSIDDLDAGIRDCIAAQQACRAYEFRLGAQTQKRHGNFLADFLNFRRLTQTRGWRFEGVVLVRQEVVLFRNHGGEPKIDIVEERVNPLGPLQVLGEAAARSTVMP
jgi:hypothetical protein